MFFLVATRVSLPLNNLNAPCSTTSSTYRYFIGHQYCASLRLIIICNRHLSSPDLSLSTVSLIISHTTPFSLFVDRFYLAIYVVINMGISAFALSRELYSRLRSWSAGRALFRDMLSAVLYAPMTFYDTTPLGRIINRFSKVRVCVCVCVCVCECVCVSEWVC